VAQSNLQNDASGEPVNHPRIDCYFAEFTGSAYILKERNASDGCGI
jgi:heat shock protein HspQ